MPWFLKWIAAAAILVVLAIAAPQALRLAFLLSTPPKCGDEIGARGSNKRGDVAAENLRVCFGLEAFVDYSITLQAKEFEKAVKLVEYAPSSDAGDPIILRWIDDDTLSIDLGKVRWISQKTAKVDSIHITYVYSKGE